MQEALPETEEEKIIGELLKKSSELYLEIKKLEKNLKNEMNDEKAEIFIREEISKLEKEKNKTDLQIGKIQSDLRNKN